MSTTHHSIGKAVRSLLSAIGLARSSPVDDILSGPAVEQHGIWRGLQHRGQPSARGIMGKHNDPATLGGKPPSRRANHRSSVKLMHVGDTRPDFSAQIAREAKAVR